VVNIAEKNKMGLWKRIAETRSGQNNPFKKKHEGPFDVSIEDTGKTHRFERSRWDPKAAEEYNQRLQAWGAKLTTIFPVSISGQGIKGSKLARSIRNTYYYEYGEIYRLGFTFAREGIFVHKGVGRGYVMNNGIVVKLSKNPLGFRKPSPWFNPVVEQHIDELKQIVIDYTKDSIINSTRIYIR
jgi:hypothetical protein